MNLQLHSLRTTAHLSASQLKTFVMCPRKYALAYVERVEPAFRPVAFAFGTAWHRTIGGWLTGATSNGELGASFRDDLNAELRSDGPPVLFDGDENEASLGDLGANMIVAFTANVPAPGRVLEVELPFSMDLANPDTGEVLGVPLIGAMDAVVVENGAPVVWELKTAKRKWSADQLGFDLQATAYQLAARARGYDRATVKMLITTKSAKPAVQIETVHRGPGDERDLVATAKSLLKSVEAGIDHPVRGWQCKTCQYAGACQ